MKKIFYLIMLLSLVGFFQGPLAASTTDIDGRTTAGAGKRMGMVFGRGLLNAGGVLLEIPRTVDQETKLHHKVWPVTMFPRSLHNFLIRAASSVHDVFIFPWVVPFTDDISPWTEPMGLPEYPWTQK